MNDKLKKPRCPKCGAPMSGHSDGDNVNWSCTRIEYCNGFILGKDNQNSNKNTKK